MIIRTVRLLTLKALSAGMYLIVKWMILLLLPSMGELAAVFVFASIRIRLHEVLGLPLRALLSLIVEHMRFPPEILPVVRVDASIPGMLGIRIGTPDRLKVKHVEIGRVLAILSVRGKFVQQVNSDLLLRVSESAHITIVARLDSPRIALTELDLVLFRVVKLFHPVVRFGAAVSHIALISLLCGEYMLTDLGSVGT